jgi:hypothetical protein
MCLEKPGFSYNFVVLYRVAVLLTNAVMLVCESCREDG